MIDFTRKSDAEIVRSPAPLKFEDVQQLLTDENKVAIIDYETSTMRGRQLLVYLSNLGLNYDIAISDKVTKEERFELLREYMEFHNQVELPTLVYTVAAVLTAIKGIDDFYLELDSPMLSKEEVIEFIQENQILVSKWMVLMDSMIVYAMKASNTFQDAFGDPKYKYPHIDDERAVGKNFIYLFALPMFMELYYSVPGTRFYYFTKQFEEPMFAFQHLFYYFWKPGNPLIPSLEALGFEHYNVGDLTAAYDADEAKVFGE